LTDEGTAVLIGLVAIGGILLLSIASTALGAFVGWLVGLTPLGQGVMRVWTGLTGVKCEMWELGSFLGFISGFFQSIINSIAKSFNNSH